jgi:putative endonuclease
MKALHLVRGRWAEQRANSWLRKRGLKTLATNFHCRYGELDMVMLDGSCLVIVEVRFRAHGNFGDGSATVTRAKQLKLARATQLFLGRHRAWRNHPLRFDVMSLSMHEGRVRYDWIRNAFSVDEAG